MKKVFVVIERSYAETNVCGVFDDHAGAKEGVAEFVDRNDLSEDCMDIEVWELNNMEWDSALKGL